MPMDPSSVHPDNVESGKMNNFSSLNDCKLLKHELWVLKWNKIILKLFLKLFFTFLIEQEK